MSFLLPPHTLHLLSPPRMHPLQLNSSSSRSGRRVKGRLLTVSAVVADSYMGALATWTAFLTLLRSSFTAFSLMAPMPSLSRLGSSRDMDSVSD